MSPINTVSTLVGQRSVSLTMQISTCLLILGFALCAHALPSSRVVGGHDAPEGKYPYQVSLRRFGSHFCGGSILNKRYILTAAHCLVRQVASSVTVIAGTNYLSDTETAYRADKLIVHSGYHAIRRVNDIGLIRVTRNIEFTKFVQPIRIATSTESIAGEYAILTGWGRLEAGGRIPNSLQEIDLKIIPTAECKRTHLLVKRSHVCTYTKYGQGACNGDSGGPLVIDGLQVGVVSYGRPCGIGYPDVFTRVATYKDWIQEHME